MLFGCKFLFVYRKMYFNIFIKLLSSKNTRNCKFFCIFCKKSLRGNWTRNFMNRGLRGEHGRRGLLSLHIPNPALTSKYKLL